MTDLTNMIGIIYFNFNYKGHYLNETKTKGNPPATQKTQIAITGMTIKRRIHLLMSDTSTLCGSLTDIQNGGKL